MLRISSAYNNEGDHRVLETVKTPKYHQRAVGGIYEFLDTLNHTRYADLVLLAANRLVLE